MSRRPALRAEPPQTLHQILSSLAAAGISERYVLALERELASAIERCAAEGDEAFAEFLADSPIPWVLAGEGDS